MPPPFIRAHFINGYWYAKDEATDLYFNLGPRYSTVPRWSKLGTAGGWTKLHRLQYALAMYGLRAVESVETKDGHIHTTKL